MFLGVTGNAYSMAVGARWMISAVARVFEPGCKADCVLILEGDQGKGKSSAIEVLAGSEHYSELDLDLRSKDSVQNILGKWLVELGELSALTRSEVNQVKAFMSRKVDRIRPSYERRARDLPRRCVFCGTTNAHEYLRDETGNRRFWPVLCTHIDLAALRLARDQIWAEAVHRYRAGEPWHLDDPEVVAAALRAQNARRPEDAWYALLAAWSNGMEAVAMADALEAVGLKPSQWTRAEEMRASIVLRALGYSRDDDATELPNGRRTRLYRKG
jgi:putative DNA primase/helicase